MRESEITKEIIFGVRGITPLIEIPNFDVSSCTPVDFMHAVCLGSVKYLTEIWFGSKNNKMDYYLGLKTKLINKRLTQINPYSEISRYPREITERNQWKANEWLNWLLYYSNPSLIQILSSKYYDHFQKLRKAIRILLGSGLTENKIRKSEKTLKKFVKQFQEYYGEKYMVYNIHLLLHLAESVRNFGPLWNYSLFPYENMNGYLKNFVKGPNEPLIQINTKYLLSHHLNYTDFSCSAYRDDVIQFCEKMNRSATSNCLSSPCKN